MKQLIAANWKMNGMPDWTTRIEELEGLIGKTNTEVLICPPHPLIGYMATESNETSIAIGAQDCSEHEAGAHTGETDAELIAAMGASYVIVGHSERRAAGESDARVRAKSERAIACGLRPIICVGESFAQREAGDAVAVVTAQLKASMPEKGMVDIAYEPIWAIGTGKTATIEDIALMHAAIRKAIVGGPRILYGGSVKPDNAGLILSAPNVGGALVGGASLEMDSFSQIVKAGS